MLDRLMKALITLLPHAKIRSRQNHYIHFLCETRILPNAQRMALPATALQHIPQSLPRFLPHPTPTRTHPPTEPPSLLPLQLANTSHTSLPKLKGTAQGRVNRYTTADLTHLVLPLTSKHINQTIREKSSNIIRELL